MTSAERLGLEIAPALPRDLDRVMELLEESRKWLIAKGITRQWPTPHPREVFVDRMEREELYVARRGRRTVGTFSLLWSDPGVWADRLEDGGYVHALAVSRSEAGRGIGAALLECASGLVASRGRTCLRLDCWAGNPELCRYYEGLGFERRGTVDLGDGFVVQRYERRADRGASRHDPQHG